MGIILGLFVIVLFIGGVVNEVNKNKGNAYLAKKYDEEKKNNK